MTQALTTRPPDGLEKTVRGWIQYAAGAFPEDIADEKLKRAATRLKVAILAAADPQKLMTCSAESIGRCVALSAMTELYPGSGEMKPDVWLIPRAGKLNWQMGAASYKRLALRAGYDLSAFLVYEGEYFKLFQGTDPHVEHEVDLENEPSMERLRGGYVISTAPDGRRKIAWLTKERILQRKKIAQTANVWNSWPLEMAEKTLYNYAGGRELFPLDEVTRRAIAADNQAETGGLEAVIEPPRPPLVTSTRALEADTGAAPEPEDVPQAEPVPAEDVPQGDPGSAEPESQEPAGKTLDRLEFEIRGACDDAGKSFDDLVQKMGPPPTWADHGITEANLLSEVGKLPKAKRSSR